MRAGDWVEVLGTQYDQMIGRVSTDDQGRTVYSDNENKARFVVQLLPDGIKLGLYRRNLKRHTPTEDEEYRWCLMRLE